MAKKLITKEKALERLQSLCGRSEQCEFDLIRKMINWGINPSDRKEILEYLKENRYLDEARFSRSFANDKARFSAWGPKKIRIELIKRKINSSLISEALHNVDQKYWKEGLLRIANSKAKTLDLVGEESRENKQKLFRYLISRGFPSKSVVVAVNLMKKRQEEAND